MRRKISDKQKMAVYEQIKKLYINCCKSHRLKIDEDCIDTHDFWSGAGPIELSEKDRDFLIVNLVFMLKVIFRHSKESGRKRIIDTLPCSTKSALVRILPHEFSGPFQDRWQLPDDFHNPSIWFAFSDSEDPETPITVRDGITRKYGKTTVTLRGLYLRPSDAIVLGILFNLLNSYKTTKVSDDSISFSTTLREITRHFDPVNPRKKSSLRAAWRSLIRLAGVVVEIKKPGAYWSIGHILDSAEMNLDDIEDSAGNLDADADLKVYLGKRFFELATQELRLTQIIKEDAYALKSKSSALCVFLFLCSQKGFYREGGTPYQIGVEKLADYSGLVRPEQKKPRHVIHNQCIEALRYIRDKGIAKIKIKRGRNGNVVHVQKGGD